MHAYTQVQTSILLQLRAAAHGTDNTNLMITDAAQRTANELAHAIYMGPIPKAADGAGAG